MDMREKRKREEQLRKYKADKERRDKYFYNNLADKNMLDSLRYEGYRDRDIDPLLDDIDRIRNEE